METIYRGGTISANGKTAVITFRSGWGDPGDWDIDFYRDKIPCSSLTIHEDDGTTADELIRLGLEFTRYDDTALAEDLAFLAASREEIRTESENLSAFCSQNAPSENVIVQLRKINNIAGRLLDQCLRIEAHIAVYKTIRQGTG
jgi:hypothetical protein